MRQYVTNILPSAICVLVAFALQQPNFERAAEPARPNVVFFLVDDLGWRDLGCYGSSFYETPNIDQFASDGMRFTQAYADGVSLAPLLKGEKKLARQAIYWHFPHYCNHGMQSPGGAGRAGDYKLLEYPENDAAQLFNLKDDIGEQNDLSSAEPDKVAELRVLLRAWRREVSAQMMTPNPGYVSPKWETEK